MRPLAAVLVVVLAGCSRMPYGTPKSIDPTRWQHETKTTKDFDLDRYECERDNRSSKRQLASELRDRCMLTKGWSRR